MKNLDVFGLFLGLRVLSVFLVQTSYVPDEYWQSLEVAHKISFGYGYLTWEWTKGIRSYVYPLVISLFYTALKLAGLDSAPLLIYGPRILQAILSAYSDLCFYRWTGAKKWAIFSVCTAWFWFYTGSRTLINTFETSLTTVALSKFPWLGKGKDSEGFTYFWISAFLCAIRPTAAIVWLPLCLYHLFSSKYQKSQVVFGRFLPISAIILAATTLLDSLCHGGFLLSPYEFFKFNVFGNIGAFYGTHPWFWYMSTGFPAMMGIQFVPFVVATLVVLKNRISHPNELALLSVMVFTMTIYSFLPHKEFRFILPLLPIALYLSSRYLSVWSRKSNTLLLWTVAIIIFLGNIGPAYYISYVHQRGVLDVMGPLRGAPEKSSFLFLMPCHSTPFQSHLHRNITARFLTCEPNFNSTDTNYVDEAESFYTNPNWWLRRNYPPNGTLPSHIVCFDVLKPAISDILSRYKTTHEFFHTDFPSGREGRSVLINELV